MIISTCWAKALTAIDKLSIIWKSDLSYEIKQDFCQAMTGVSTTVWMHQTHGEKVRWKLHKNVCCCFEQILETTKTPNNSCTATYLPFYKTIQVRWTRHVHNWKSKNKLISDVLLCALSHGHTSVGWPARTYFHQFCADTRCSLNDLPRAGDNRDGWSKREKVKEIHDFSVTWWCNICIYTGTNLIFICFLFLFLSGSVFFILATMGYPNCFYLENWCF